MFLNDLGEPVAVDAFESQNLDPSAPLVIARSTISLPVISENWSGKVYTTQSVLNELQLKFVQNVRKWKEEKRIVELKPNQTIEITFPFENKRILLTAFPWTKGRQQSKLIFLVKDQFLTRICIDILSITLNPIISNTSLRKVIQEGINIVHFNDVFAKGIDPKDRKLRHIWASLHLLIYLIRPKTLRGFYDTTPPKYIRQCCSDAEAH